MTDKYWNPWLPIVLPEVPLKYEDVVKELDGYYKNCTCAPEEAPVPCQKKFAYSECKAAERTYVSDLSADKKPSYFEAKKLDDDKLMMALLEPEFQEEMVKALTYGAKTYGVFNWRNGFDWSRPLSACLRHINAWRKGEQCDSESKAHHLAAAAVNLMFLYYHEKDGLGRNDLRTIK